MVIDLIGTEEPPRVGEYESEISMTCRFEEEEFDDDYRDQRSIKFINYRKRVYQRMRYYFLLKFLRLLSIIFISLE